MKNKKRVICAMSGGVDSSVAAAMLKKQGYEVIGVFMKLWAEDTERTDLVRENICCSVEAATAARAVANKLDISFYVVNFASEFKKAVVDYYIKEYESGRTPNPCVVCNRDIKGEILMKKVDELGGDYLATGHYARIGQCHSERSEESLANVSVSNKLRDSACLKAPSAQDDIGKYQLLQAKDRTKDQTYFLWTLTPKQLAKLLFPVGDFTKTEVRAMAKKWQLPTAERKESQGICFIPDRNVGGFLHRHAKKLTEPGPIIDRKGKRIGAHSGLVNYTVGQRERLGIGGPKAYYVVKLDSRNNTLICGDDKDLYQKKLIAADLNWISLTNNLQAETDNIGAKIRHGHPIVDSKLQVISSDKVKVTFTKAQRAITPGQSIVFYQKEKVLGGGVIENHTNN